MLLSITTTQRPATDLGYLLHKHPGRCQSYDLSFGGAHVFYPEATDERCTACLLLDVNSVTLIRAIHGSLTYRDRRLEGFDSAAVVEVIEQLDLPRLAAFERNLFEFARPRVVVLTTPYREYNVTWEAVGTEKLRHADHRFEWTRQEFRAWADGTATRFGYSVRFLPIGPENDLVGPPTQMGLFETW